MSLERAWESIMMRGMVIDMNDAKLRTLDQVRALLQGTVALEFSVLPEQRYEFIARTVRRFGYARLGRADKGLVLRFLMHVSGYSRQQLSRLVARAQAPVALRKRYRASRTSFGCTYTEADVRVLAHTDSLHDTLSGPATKKLMERAYRVFGEQRYERLATISVGHLYNLRKRSGYGRVRKVWTKTRSVHIAIGERRAPAPENRPGFLRLDSVHQGDQDGLKGLYHINAVDCVTQYQAVASCEQISEAFLLPVLEALLQSFPFTILGFHVDNGSEYINHRVAELLNKLLIEQFTKSRPRHSNDNALVESKNGAVIRKHFGYSHIPQRYAQLVNAHCAEYLNPYLNFHRPCLFAETLVDSKGRQRKRYPYKLMMTPYEKLKSLPNAKQCLKKAISFKQLDAQASAMSDNEAARRLNEARSALFRTIFNRSKSAA
jgi:transposase InsO family protein